MNQPVFWAGGIRFWLGRISLYPGPGLSLHPVVGSQSVFRLQNQSIPQTKDQAIHKIRSQSLSRIKDQASEIEINGYKGVGVCFAWELNL